MDRTCGNGDSAELKNHVLSQAEVCGGRSRQVRGSCERQIWIQDEYDPQSLLQDILSLTGETALITVRRQVNASDKEPGARPSLPRLEASASNCPGGCDLRSPDPREGRLKGGRNFSSKSFLPGLISDLKNPHPGDVYSSTEVESAGKWIYTQPQQDNLVRLW